MDPRHLELAADFCKLAGKANLIEYLGLPPGCSAEEAQEMLRRKRKYMQGMQANPKYRNEALQFIKHFSTFQQLLQDPVTYLREARRVSETTHLPILEMAIKGALKGGAPSPEQIDYLRRNATELGVGEDTFVGALDRLAAEAGIPLHGALRPMDHVDEVAVDNIDYYAVLGVPRSATRAEIYAAYTERYRQLQGAHNKAEAAREASRLDAAWSVLGDASQREGYDLSHRSTGPPARDREITDPSVFRTGASSLGAPTAPPVRQRTHTPHRNDSTPSPTGAGAAPVGRRASSPPSSVTPLQIVGETTRRVSLARGPIALAFEVLTDTAARVSSSDPWVIVQPSRLEAGRGRHELVVRMDPGAVPANVDEATVSVQTDRGERALLTLRLTRPDAPSVPVPLLAGVAAALVIVIVVALWVATH